MDKVKAQIEELLYENAADFQIAKVLKQDIKIYFDTLEETFATSGGERLPCQAYKKNRQHLSTYLQSGSTFYVW